jgi:hypothetical protein
VWLQNLVGLLRLPPRREWLVGLFPETDIGCRSTKTSCLLTSFDLFIFFGICRQYLFPRKYGADGADRPLPGAVKMRLKVRAGHGAETNPAIPIGLLGVLCSSVPAAVNTDCFIARDCVTTQLVQQCLQRRSPAYCAITVQFTTTPVLVTARLVLVTMPLVPVTRLPFICSCGAPGYSVNQSRSVVT